MIKHFKNLRKMTVMIRNLKAAGNILTKEQQILYHALPKSWNIMKLTMTHNKCITTYSMLSFILSLKRSDKDSRVILLLMWLSLVSTGYLGLNANNMIKHVRVRS